MAFEGGSKGNKEAAQAASAAAISKARGARGRKDADKQEAVIQTKPLKDSLKELAALKKKADAAKERLGDAIKATAEKAGLLASVVRKFVNAKSSEKFEEESRKVEQTALVFEELRDVQAE